MDIKQKNSREILTTHWATNNYTVPKQSLHTVKIKLYSGKAIITHCENFLAYLRKFSYILAKNLLHTCETNINIYIFLINRFFNPMSAQRSGRKTYFVYG